jgi:osmotically-inducible protein OsmY
MKKTQFIAATLLAGSLIGNVALAAESAGKAVDDTWITTKVKTDLAKDKSTSATKIHVNTKAGVVVLTGTVPSAAEKEKAEQDARSVKGVVDVENQLNVAP